MDVKPVVYVPLLGSKRGEYNALYELDSEVREYTKPIIKLTEYETITRGGQLATRIKDKWGNDPIYIDLNHAKDLDIEGVNLIDFILKDLNTNNIDYSLIIDAHYPDQKIVNHALQNETRSCISVDIRSFDSNTLADFQNLLNSLLSANTLIDVLLDFKSDIKSTPSDHANHIYNYYEPIYNSFRNQLDRFIITGSVMPKELDKDKYTPYGLEERTHWLGFCQFLKSLNQETSSIIFSDYSMSYFEEEEFDNFVNPNAKIKYTVDDNFVFFVGNQVFKRNGNDSDGLEQFQTLAETIVDSEYYLGFTYSWGDKRIYECANGTDTFGNLETWVKAGHNHHITYATKQNASRYGISI